MADRIEYELWIKGATVVTSANIKLSLKLMMISLAPLMQWMYIQRWAFSMNQQNTAHDCTSPETLITALY